MIDLESGHVILAEATIDVDMDRKFEKRTSKISGTLAVHFERKEAWKGNWCCLSVLKRMGQPVLTHSA